MAQRMEGAGCCQAGRGTPRGASLSCAWKRGEASEREGGWRAEAALRNLDCHHSVMGSLQRAGTSLPLFLVDLSEF